MLFARLEVELVLEELDWQFLGEGEETKVILSLGPGLVVHAAGKSFEFSDTDPIVIALQRALSGSCLSGTIERSTDDDDGLMLLDEATYD